MNLQTPTAEEIYSAAAAAGARPDPMLTISQWADKYRALSQRASAEPGPWRTERTPYLREIMDCLSPSSPIERTVFMKGAQIGGTECGNNWIGYVIHQAPGPMMAVQPTVEMAKRNSKQRIDPLIEESEVLRALVSDPRSRDSGNTVLSKEFPGGVLVMTGANSAVGLRSMAARYLFLDEVDGYPGDVEGEGDPVNLATARTRTFARRKIFMCSTPKITGMSRIEAAFEESDKRWYWVPCPVCREFQTLKFAQVRWPKGEPGKAVYVCEHCGQEIQNHQKQSMLARGEWCRGRSGCRHRPDVHQRRGGQGEGEDQGSLWRRYLGQGSTPADRGHGEVRVRRQYRHGDPLAPGSRPDPVVRDDHRTEGLRHARLGDAAFTGRDRWLVVPVAAVQQWHAASGAWRAAVAR